MMNDATARRKSLLSTLFFQDNGSATVRTLAHELETVHNTVASKDAVRSDLSWLADVGLVKFADDAALISERGRDVVRQAAAWPGE